MIGLLPETFWNMTWDEFHRASEGFNHREELAWERERYTAAMIYNANSKHPKKPQELVPLKLDGKRKEISKAQTTQEDVERILRKFQNRLIPQNGKQ